MKAAHRQKITAAKVADTRNQLVFSSAHAIPALVAFAKPTGMRKPHASSRVSRAAGIQKMRPFNLLPTIIILLYLLYAPGWT